MEIAVIGASGLVGREILKVLEMSNLPIDNLIAVASNASVGKIVSFKNKDLFLTSSDEALKTKPQIAIFSAGNEVSIELAPIFASNGTTVIDNSSAWRMDTNVPLIVPEINAHILTKEHKIIANPNCSTIQMHIAIAPLHKEYRIKRIVISTYQSVTGSGMKGVAQLENERRGIKGEMFYPFPIHNNLFPYGGNMLENGYTSEEMKLINETHKILNDNSINITATVVRVPVMGGHSESINLEFEKDYVFSELIKLLKTSKGIIVNENDDFAKDFPHPLNIKGRDEVFISRIRRDFSVQNGINLWVSADNLRKGAATNAVQIAQYLFDNGLLE